MSKTTHTAGPWQWRHRLNRSAELVAPHHGTLLVMDAAIELDSYDEPSLRLAVREGNNGGLMVDSVKIDLSKHPDARLIAAAPDLLAQLKQLEWSGRNLALEYRGMWWRCCPSCDAPAPDSRMGGAGQHHEGCTLAAVIAKAERGTPCP